MFCHETTKFFHLLHDNQDQVVGPMVSLGLRSRCQNVLAMVSSLSSLDVPIIVTVRSSWTWTMSRVRCLRHFQHNGYSRKCEQRHGIPILLVPGDGNGNGNTRYAIAIAIRTTFSQVHQQNHHKGQQRRSSVDGLGKGQSIMHRGKRSFGDEARIFRDAIGRTSIEESLGSTELGASLQWQ